MASTVLDGKALAKTMRGELDHEVAEFKAQYDEYAAARQLISLRRRRYRDLPTVKVKSRLYAYLCRRGFPQEIITEAIRQTENKR